MKKVLLYAYDQRNLGDDLFVHTIANRYPDVKFYLWSDAVNKTTFSCLKNLEVLDQDSSKIRFLKKIRPSFVAKYKNQKEDSCDCIVFIGGSIFMEYDNWQQTLAWWEYEAQRHKIYVLGANFGPFHTDAFRDGFSKVFEKIEDVCLRDRYSQALFADVETVRCAPDILFSYPMPERNADEKKVFVSVIDCASKDEGDNDLTVYEHAYIETMVTLLTGLIEKGYKIVLSSFCKAEGDENAIEKIRAELPEDKTKAVNYNGTNAQEVLDQISESSMIIASRFHAAIFGFAADKPVLPVIYSDKTKHVLEDASFQGQCLDIRNLEQIDIDALIKNSDRQRLPKIDQLKKESESHFMKLDPLLK